MERIRKLLKNKSGIAMIVVLAVTAIAFLLVTTVFLLSSSELSLTKKDENYQKASYLARSGVEVLASAFDKLDDATKTQMTAEGAAPKDKIIPDPLWLSADGKTVVCSETSPVGALGSATGEIKVISEGSGKNLKEYYQFTCTATINETSATKKAVFQRQKTYSPNVDDWYDKQGVLLWNAADCIPYPASAVYEQTYPNINFSNHAFAKQKKGSLADDNVIVTRSEPGLTLQFPQNSASKLIEWEATKIIVNTPVDLSLGQIGGATGKAEVFSLKAQEVLFRQPVTLYVSTTDVNTDVATLLFCAQNKESEAYTIVFEKGLNLKVNTKVGEQIIQLLPPNKVTAFTFNEKKNEQLTGIDFLRYFVQFYKNDLNTLGGNGAGQVVSVKKNANALSPTKYIGQNPYMFNGYLEAGSEGTEGGYVGYDGAWENADTKETVYTWKRSGTSKSGPLYYQDQKGEYQPVNTKYKQEEWNREYSTSDQSLSGVQFYRKGWRDYIKVKGEWTSKTETMERYIWTPPSSLELTAANISELQYKEYGKYSKVPGTLTLENGKLVTDDDTCWDEGYKTLYLWEAGTPGVGEKWIEPTMPYLAYAADTDGVRELLKVTDSLDELISGILNQTQDTVYDRLIWR